MPDHCVPLLKALNRAKGPVQRFRALHATIACENSAPPPLEVFEWGCWLQVLPGDSFFLEISIDPPYLWSLNFESKSGTDPEQASGWTPKGACATCSPKGACAMVHSFAGFEGGGRGRGNPFRINSSRLPPFILHFI